MHVAKDPKLRLISKTFMKAFDELCSEQLLLLDPRIKSLVHDEEGNVILSPIGTFMPKSVPLFLLYTSYLNDIYTENFNAKFPVLNIPDNSSEKAVSNLRNQRRYLEYERLIEMLGSYINVEYNSIPDYSPPPMRLYCLYRLLVATFSEYSFINEIAKLIKFPLNKLISNAASGKLPTLYGVEILSRFSINSVPQLLFEAINSGNPDLVRAIFNNPHNDLVLLMNQRSGDHYEPMNVAAVKGNVDIINLFLNWGIPADSEGIRGFRPIHLAARHGNYDAVVRLFEFDNDVIFNPRDTDTRPCPIVLAAINGHVDVVRFFLTQDTVDLKEDRETSDLLVDAALLRFDAELGNLLIDSGKFRLTSNEIESIFMLNIELYGIKAFWDIKKYIVGCLCPN